MGRYKKVNILTGVGYELKTFIDGRKGYFLDGEYHRTHGPAIEYKNGEGSWYLNGYPVSEEELKKVQACPIKDLPLYINTKFAPLVKERLKCSGQKSKLWRSYVARKNCL